MASRLRVVYAGTPAFAVPALDRLLGESYDLVGVYTQPDRPAGRGRRLRPSPVKARALASGLRVLQPETLRGPKAKAEFAALLPDVVVVAAYGLILPRAVLAIPRYGCLNIHASLLPRWRGAAPIQRAILAGDVETGVCLMRMQAGLDTGPVLACRTTPIDDDDTAGSLHDRLAELGGQLLGESLPEWVAGRLQAQPQPSDGVTYAVKLTKQEAEMDWSHPACDLARQVRAFNPWPGAGTRIAGRETKIWRSKPLAASGGDIPGTVVAAARVGIDVATGAGTLRITVLQASGRRAQSAGEFLNGVRLAPGVRLG